MSKFSLLTAPRAARRLRWTLFGLCVLGFTFTASASNPEVQRQAQQIQQLQAEVAALKTQQAQILNVLNDLKKAVDDNTEPPVKQPQAMSVAGESFKGDAGASLAIVEYADFECPYCRRFEHETLPQLRDAYIKTGKVKYFYRDLPLTFHPHANSAARAARCAGDQGKFWELHDLLLDDHSDLSQADIDSRARKVGLDVQKLDACLASKRYSDAVQHSVDEASALNISGTPTFLIGTIAPHGDSINVKATVTGAQPFPVFKETIDPLLAANAAHKAAVATQ